jgi:MFS family permease
MATFHSTNETLSAFVTSVYLLGYSFGPLVIAPLSELYGRAIVYNICNSIFLIFSIACALANNLSALIVFRLFAGIAASCPITLGAGTIADMIPLEKRGLAMASWVMGPLVGPTFGPLGEYCPNVSEETGLTMSSRWLSCPSQGLALDLLAHIYHCKFQDSAK